MKYFMPLIILLLFVSCGEKEKDVIVTVDGSKLTKVEFEQYVPELDYRQIGEDRIKAFLDDWVQQEILYLQAKKMGIQDEDSVALEKRRAREGSGGAIDVAVAALPFISNFTDFDALEDEPDVNLRYVRKGQSIGKCDLVIIPGSKNTIADLYYLKDSGLGQEIKELAAEGVPVIGICGGYQILGREIHDPMQAESDRTSAEGLGLLEVETVFEPEKTPSG